MSATGDDAHTEDAGDRSSANASSSSTSGGSSGQSGSAVQRIMSHMSASKIEAVLWLTRLFTVFTTINFFLPIFGGNPHSSYQKILLSNAATSALRLHQRVPNFQLSRAYLSQLILEDSAHYLFFSLVFVTGAPVSMALLPVFLYAVMHAQNYTKQLLNAGTVIFEKRNSTFSKVEMTFKDKSYKMQIGPNSVQIVRNLLLKLEQQQVNILRFIACNEIFLMPALVFLIFTGQGSFLLPFMYYRFLSLRYSSRRNPYCKQLFTELRFGVESLCDKPQCPQIIRNLCQKAIGLICRLAPAV